MHSPQNGHNDHQNDPSIKTENTIDVTGNENEAEDEEENEAENEEKNEHEDLGEAPQITTVQAQNATMQRTPTPCRKPWTNNKAHGHERTCGPGNKEVTFSQRYAYTWQS